MKPRDDDTGKGYWYSGMFYLVQERSQAADNKVRDMSLVSRMQVVQHECKRELREAISPCTMQVVTRLYRQRLKFFGTKVWRCKRVFISKMRIAQKVDTEAKP